MKAICVPPIISFLLFFFQAIQHCEAQFPDPHFELISVSNALPLGFVTSSCQDEQGYLWIGTSGGLFRYDGYELLHYDYKEGKPNKLSNAIVWDVESDGEYLWISTENGLNRLHMPTDSITHFFQNAKGEQLLSSDHVETVFFTKKRDMWVGTGNGWNLKRQGDERFTRYFFDENYSRGCRGAWEDEHGNVWLSAADSLYKLDANATVVAAFGLPTIGQPGSPAKDLIRNLFEDSMGRLWIGTDQSGLFLFDPKAEKFLKRFHYQAGNPNSLAYNRISALEESDGYLWIGTYGGGLHYMDLQTFGIRRCLSEESSGLKANVVRSIFKDRTGNLWLGTEFEGFWVVKKYGTPFHIFKLSDHGFRAMKIAGMAESADGMMWMVASDGLHRFDPKRQTFKHFFFPPAESGGFPIKNIHGLSEDEKGVLWIGTSDDLFRWDGGAGFEPFLKTNGGRGYCQGWITSFLIDKDDHIWIGSMEGLCRYDPEKKQFQSYELPSNPNGYNNNNSVTNIKSDRSGRLWVCTKSGINLFQPDKGTFRFFPTNKGVLQVYEDISGRIWVFYTLTIGNLDLDSGKIEPPDLPGLENITPSAVIAEVDKFIWFLDFLGIYRYDSNKGELSLFNAENGLKEGELLHESFLQTRDGTVFIHSFNWFAYFHPKDVNPNRYVPSTVLTDIRILNRPVALGNTAGDTLAFPSPLEKRLNYMKHLELKHWQNDLTVSFSSLDFTAPENNQYRYRLLGYDTAWVSKDASQRFATFTNLDPGKYTFEVGGSNSDGRWSAEAAATLSIVILPPWWATWWARLVFAGLVLLILLGIRKYELRRQHTKAEAKRFAELDAAKSKFYTNITHEFRTPLTIILGVSEQLKAQASEGMKPGLEMVKRNGRQLLGLITQLLDLSKLESGHLKLEMKQGDITGYLRYLVESFQSYAREKKIKTHFTVKNEPLIMDFDPLRVQQMMGNLISNAIKFTPPGGKIFVSAERSGDFVQIKVKDTGIGISKEKLPKIFDRFFQADDN